jgi:hypothetical protein
MVVIGDKVGGRRILAGYGEGPFARMRIGAVLHPAVLIAFLDGVRLAQHCESLIRAVCGSTSRRSFIVNM